MAGSAALPHSADLDLTCFPLPLSASYLLAAAGSSAVDAGEVQVQDQEKEGLVASGDLASSRSLPTGRAITTLV